jgi:hypothetical protein
MVMKILEFMTFIYLNSNQNQQYSVTVVVAVSNNIDSVCFDGWITTGRRSTRLRTPLELLSPHTRTHIHSRSKCIGMDRHDFSLSSTKYAHTNTLVHFFCLRLVVVVGAEHQKV